MSWTRKASENGNFSETSFQVERGGNPIPESTGAPKTKTATDWSCWVTAGLPTKKSNTSSRWLLHLPRKASLPWPLTVPVTVTEPRKIFQPRTRFQKPGTRAAEPQALFKTGRWRWILLSQRKVHVPRAGGTIHGHNDGFTGLCLRITNQSCPARLDGHLGSEQAGLD